MADSANQNNFVLFKTLTRSATIAKSPASQFTFDIGGSDGKTGRKSFNNDYEGLAVAFTSGEITQHGLQDTCVHQHEQG